jgi:multimeric flavodoxin WrbA
LARVILINGSPRAEGNTALVLSECARAIEAAGVEAEVISFSDKKIESCTACYQCQKTGRCSIDDGLNEIAEKVRDAKGLIVGSPVYFGTARGDVMSFLQRLGMISRMKDRFLAGKVGGPIAVARRGGHTATIQEMLMFFLINDMIVPGSDYWNMAFGLNPGEVLSDSEGIKTARHFAENVGNLVQKLG